MKKILALFMSICILLCGCEKQEAVSGQSYYSFYDDLGRTVTLSEQPARVAALLGSFAQVWTLAGGEVLATADDAWEDFDLNLSEDAVNLGSTEKLSMEKLLAAQPDLILASGNRRQNMEWQETLNATGIPTAYFEVNNFEDYLTMLEICCDITGREDLYEKHGSSIEEQIEVAIAASKERLADQAVPTVLTMRASASSILAKNSESTVLGEILKDLGCVNIVDSDKNLLENLSIERILELDPDHIFFIQRGDDEEGMKAHVQSFLVDDPAWSQLTAVREGRVHFMDKALYGLKPNNRWGEAYEKAEELLSDET